MFNVGQMVHDTTNNRPIIFGGIHLNSEDGSSFTRFIQESGELVDYIHPPFEYAAYRIPSKKSDGEIYFGTLIEDLDLTGHFFGVLEPEVAIECRKEIQAAFADVYKYICRNPDCIEHGHFLGLDHVCAFDHMHICDHVHDNKCWLSGIECNGMTCKYDSETVLKMKEDSSSMGA